MNARIPLKGRRGDHIEIDRTGIETFKLLNNHDQGLLVDGHHDMVHHMRNEDHVKYL